MFDISIKEAKRVIAAIEASHGDSFADFSLQVLIFRLNRAIDLFGFKELDHFIAAIEENRDSFYEHLVGVIIPHTTEMFRDATFWCELRDVVLPDLLEKNDGSLRIWQASFDSGEELFSLLVVLEELGVRKEATVYSSYIGSFTQNRLREGRLRRRREEQNQANYSRYNPEGSLNKYFVELEGGRFFRQKLLAGVHFLRQSLEFTPWSEPPVHLVLCRNQMLYFNPSLCDRNLSVLANSLVEEGILVLGIKEVLENIQNGSTFTVLNREESIYRRRKG